MKMKRFRMTGPWMQVHPDGQWVEHDDAEARIADLESQLKAMTKERDAQAEAVMKLARVAAWMRVNMADPRIASLCLLRHVDGVEKIDTLADLFKTAWTDAMNNPIAAAAVKGGEG